MSDDCLFCKIQTGEIPADTVYENDSVYAFRDINPTAPTHVLIIPRKHIESVATLEEGDKDLMGEIMLAAQAIAKQEGIDGHRLLTNTGRDGGQVVMHIHFHLVGGRKLGWPPG